MGIESHDMADTALPHDVKAADSRRHGRHRIMLSASFYSIHGESSGVLLDISCGGAMLSASPPPPSGCRLVVERQNFEVPGVVRWVEGNRFGVQFDQPLTDEAVTVLVSKSGQQSAH